MKMSYPFRILLSLLLGTFLLAGSAAQAQIGTRSISGLSATNDTPQPLPLEQAFPFFVSAISPGRYRIAWDLPNEHYLYRHAFAFSLSQAAGSEELAIDHKMRDGLKKHDQFFGDIEAYYGQLDIDLSLSTVPGPDARIFIEYQGCADWGFCYPPQRYEFLLNP